MNEKKEVIFRAENLQTWFPITKGPFKKVVGHVKAVDGVDIEVYKGETLGIVGESGCGKSTLGKTLMMLEHATGGHVFFNYDNEFRDITAFNKKEMFDFRRKVQMVFQDPYSALNPQKKIYTSFEEPLKVHGMSLQEEREARMRQVLSMVNIQPDYLMRYPHEFSGGQRQRIGIARALAVKPEFLLCDEPISALDVSIQVQIMTLLERLQEQHGISYLFISHDLNMVRYISHRMVVMYLGAVMEEGPALDLYEFPQHPYTRALTALNGPVIPHAPIGAPLKGDPPNPLDPPKGCLFSGRCPEAEGRCFAERPPLRDWADRRIACWHI